MRVRRIVVVALLAVEVAACPDLSGPEEFASVKIINSSSATLSTFHYWPCGSAEIGPDRLKSPILPGGNRTFERIKPGCYKMRVTDALAAKSAECTQDLEKNTLFKWSITG